MKTEYLVKFRDTSNELYHHGILGQKWGDRNGPPYPLGSGKHSISERSDISKTKREELKSNLYKAINKYKEEAEYYSYKDEDTLAKKFSYASTTIKKDFVDGEGYHRLPAALSNDYRTIEENDDGTQRILVTRETPGYSFTVPTFAITIQEGDKLYVAGYTNEGIIRRGIGDKAVEGITKAYNNDSSLIKSGKKITLTDALRDDDLVEELSNNPDVKNLFSFYDEAQKVRSEAAVDRIANEHGGYHKLFGDTTKVAEKIVADRYGDAANSHIVGVKYGNTDQSYMLLRGIYLNKHK